MIDVSAGIILRDGLVLLCQRSSPPRLAGLWEFPGGKREEDETSAACLARECREELAVALCIGPLILTQEYPGMDGQTLRFSFFGASIAHGEPQCLEHSALRWVAPQALRDYALCPPDEAALDPILRWLETQPIPPDGVS